MLQTCHVGSMRADLLREAVLFQDFSGGKPQELCASIWVERIYEEWPCATVRKCANARQSVDYFQRFLCGPESCDQAKRTRARFCDRTRWIPASPMARAHGCGSHSSGRDSSRRLRWPDRWWRFHRRSFSGSRHGNHRHQLRRMQCDKLVRSRSRAVFSFARQQRSPSELVSVRRRRDGRSGHD